MPDLLNFLFLYFFRRELRGVCMSHSCGQLWVVQDAAKAAIIYDPKSGENQSDALVTYEEMMANE